MPANVLYGKSFSLLRQYVSNPIYQDDNMFADDSSDDMLDLLNFLDMVSALYKASFLSTKKPNFRSWAFYRVSFHDMT